VLIVVPGSGRPLEIAGIFEKVVVVRPRRWSYRLVYEVCDRDLILHYIDPSWRKRRVSEI
jgi:hypothetical protein